MLRLSVGPPRESSVAVCLLLVECLRFRLLRTLDRCDCNDHCFHEHCFVESIDDLCGFSCGFLCCRTGSRLPEGLHCLAFEEAQGCSR